MFMVCKGVMIGNTNANNICLGALETPDYSNDTSEIFGGGIGYINNSQTSDYKSGMVTLSPLTMAISGGVPIGALQSPLYTEINTYMLGGSSLHGNIYSSLLGSLRILPFGHKEIKGYTYIEPKTITIDKEVYHSSLFNVTYICNSSNNTNFYLPSIWDTGNKKLKVVNLGTGVVTVIPKELSQIDTSDTYNLSTNDSITLATDGYKWYII